MLAGDLAAAEQDFKRAAAFDPGAFVLYEAEEAVGSYHLANIYEEIGRLDKAIMWYQQALEQDINLGVAYNNLGRLYILQNNPDLAVQVLQAGVRQTPFPPKVEADVEEEAIVRYRLLSNLGWAYYVLEQPTRARQVLEEAIALENQVDSNYRSAVPHHYLALIYEAQEAPQAAMAQWEESLRYVDESLPEQFDWEEIARMHLDKLREEKR